MATRGHVRTDFGPPTGYKPLAIEVRLRFLTQAGLVPSVSRGQRSPHYTAEHLKNVILGLVSELPSDAAEAVRVLNDLPCSTNALANVGDYSGVAAVQQGMTLGDYLIQEIKAPNGGVTADYMVVDPEVAPFVEPRQINLSLRPPRAVNIRHVIGQDRRPVLNSFHIETFGRSDPNAHIGQNTLPFYRQVFISNELLVVAHKLLAHTLAVQAAASKPKPTPARAGEDNASLKNSEAAGPASHDGLSDTLATNTHRRQSLSKTDPISSRGGRQSPPSSTSNNSGVRVQGASSATLIL